MIAFGLKYFLDWKNSFADFAKWSLEIKPGSGRAWQTGLKYQHASLI